MGPLIISPNYNDSDVRCTLIKHKKLPNNTRYYICDNGWVWDDEMNELKTQVERYIAYWKKYSFNTYLNQD